MLAFSRENLRKSHETGWLLLDLVMLGVLLINLMWLLFDAFYETRFIQSVLNTSIPGFTDAYNPIHENFLIVDLAFIAVFLTEFFVRWVVSVRKKEHPRWYFFPFLRWYDLIGCIPSPTTRLFRVFRVVSIVYRLHKYRIIDLNSTAIFRFFSFYYEVLVEELSDRIVVKVLSDAQKDIAAGSPLVSDIQTSVLQPRLAIVSRYVAGMMNHLGQSITDTEHGQVIRQHVHNSVGKAVKNNAQVSTFSMIPVVGRGIENTLEAAVTDIVTASLINLLSDIDSNQVDQFLRHGLNEFTPEDEVMEEEMLAVINECLELVKSHVAQQRWMEELNKTDDVEYEPVEESPIDKPSVD